MNGYLIKNMNMIDIDAPYFPFPKDSKFTKLLQMGRLSNYTSEELDQYYYALKVYRDNRNVYEYMMESEERGFDGKRRAGLGKRYGKRQNRNGPESEAIGRFNRHYQAGHRPIGRGDSTIIKRTSSEGGWRSFILKSAPFV